MTQCLDYGRSFICNTASFNAVRFWIESRTVLHDDRDGGQVTFLQCGSCKSENTFAETDLFMSPNYDFMPIFGDDRLLIFRRHADARETYREIRPVDLWGAPDYRLVYGEPVRELTTFEEIRDVTATEVPIVARTEITNSESGLRAVIEYPVKTMNISLDKRIYQVDTGPVALPDLSERHQPAVDSVRLAFVAFNAGHFADFVIEQPTPVTRDGQEVATVHHYSNPISRPATNSVFAVGQPSI